jgi:hypothetical protein
MAASGSQPAPVLRPLGIADILDAALRLYRQNFGPLLGITAIVFVPVAILQIVGAYYMGTFMGPQGEGSEAQVGGMVVFGVFMLGSVLVYLLAMPICQGALSIAVARRYLGQPITVADAYHMIGDRWGTLLAGVMLVGLMTSMGMLLCLVPGIYLATLFIFVTPVIAVEGLPLMDALRRSRDLVSGEWWRCFGTYLLLSMLIQMVAGAVVYPVTFASAFLLMERNPGLAQALNQGISMAVSVFAQPVQIIGLVLLYYDLRVRKEGFDLELLAQNLGTKAPAAAAPQPLLAAYQPGDYAPPPPMPGAALPPRLDEADQLSYPAPSPPEHSNDGSISTQ